MRTLSLVVTAGLAAGATHAHADPEVAPPAALTAADVRDAPLPGAEHGRLDPIDPPESIGHRLARLVLWIPRIPVEVVMQPVRGALYMQERYDVIGSAKDVVFTDDRKIGVYPTALVETGFGLNVGARAVFKDIFGQDERIKLRAGLGGQYKRVAAIDVDSGTRIAGRVSAGIDARYELRGTEHFYGYGNGDLQAPTAGMPIDPTRSDVAIASQYRLRVARFSPRLHIKLADEVSVTLTGAVIRKRFEEGDAEDVQLGAAYQVDRLPGFQTGTTYLYDEAEVAWDTRAASWALDPPGIRSAGGLALLFVGRQDGIDDGPAFYRGGVDLQRYIALSHGPRVLELRFYGELVSGPRDQVPFTELPRLGGRTVLRGYETDRFRDRVATVGQVGYRWALGWDTAANVFVDAGRVHPSIHHLSVDDLRVGFGAAVEAYNRHGMLLRAEVASSIDGGFMGYVSVEPAFDARARVERN